MDRAIYKQKIIDIVTEMKSRLTDPNNTATEDFAEGFTVALEAAGIMSVSFVEELPDEGIENVLYIDKVLLRFAIWQDDDWDFFSSGSGSGMTFTDLVAILQEGNNVTLDVDLVNETITINSTVTPTVTYIRRSDYISADRKSYLAFAPQGSLETDAVWTITKRVGSADGTIVSNVQYVNKKWTERGLL
jgi:hypothetical protein